jgi:putative DNA primase/helicase
MNATAIAVDSLSREEALQAKVERLEAALAEKDEALAEKDQGIEALQGEIARLHRIIDDEPWVDDLFAKSQRIVNPKEKLIAWGYRKVFPNVPLNADGLGESPATEISRITGIPRPSVLETLCRFGRMGVLNHPDPHREPLFDQVTGKPIFYTKGKRKGQQAWESTSFSSPTELFDDLSRWDVPPELEHKPSGYHPPKEKAPPIPTCPFCGEPATKEHATLHCENKHEWEVTRTFEREEEKETQSAISDPNYDSDLADIFDQESHDDEVPPPESENAICPATLIKEETQIAFSEVEVQSPPPQQQPALEELQAYAQWCCWRYGSLDLVTGKRKKIPINPRTGANADHSDPLTWAFYDEALTFRASARVCDGIGFVFHNDYTGIDLDGCRDPETGRIEEWAWEIIRAIASYTEISVSGKGVHIIAKGTIPAGVKRLLDGHKVEMYSTRRFFTWSGEQLPGTPNTIEDRQSEITALYEQISPKEVFSPGRDFPPAQDCASIATLADDQALLERALKDDLFATLMAGDTFKYHGGDWSSADLALCRKLKFYTDGVRSRMDTLFRQSGLMRPKWDEVHYSTGETYGQHTIALVFDDPPVHTKLPPATEPAIREAVPS